MGHLLRAAMDCEVMTANSGVAALKILETGKFDIVISDMAMPGMDGADLLNTVHELYPDTVRLIFSARSGGDSALRAVEATHQYFMKPLSASVLGERIANMLKFKEMLPSEGIENIVAEAGALPAIPAVYNELDAMLRDGNVSADNVGQILEKDLAMSAKILQLVNSAFFGLRETVTKPAQAVSLLGLNTVKSLFLGLHVMDEWKGEPACGFSPTDLWKHSMQVASGAMEIASSMGLKQETAGEIYCAGLFHDIGKLLIFGKLPESLAQITKIKKQGMSWADAEAEILGASHAEVGAYLMALWGFPMSVVKALAFHHHPEKSGETGFSSVMAVHVANCFCRDGADADDNAVLAMDYIKEQGMGDKLKDWKSLLTR
jgi:putative nucleotidyltransferase with HDIG domain